METLDLPGAEIELHQQIWSRSQGDTLCGLLIKELNWRQDKISMFGQTHDVPRLNAWYGDADCSYSWSGITMTPNPWNSTLRDIREKVNGVASEQFNSVLANFIAMAMTKLIGMLTMKKSLGKRRLSLQ